MEKRLELTYPTGLIKEPIIYEVGQKFRVVTNIRRANIDEQVGWVVLSLEGDEREINRAVEYFQHKGVKVSPVTRDVVES